MYISYILLVAITRQTYIKGKFCLAHIKCRVKTQMFLIFSAACFLWKACILKCQRSRTQLNLVTTNEIEQGGKTWLEASKVQMGKKIHYLRMLLCHIITEWFPSKSAWHTGRLFGLTLRLQHLHNNLKVGLKFLLPHILPSHLFPQDFSFQLTLAH